MMHHSSRSEEGVTVWPLDGLSGIIIPILGVLIAVVLIAVLFYEGNRRILARKSILAAVEIEPTANRIMRTFAGIKGDKKSGLDVSDALSETNLLKLPQVDRHDIVMNLIRRGLVKGFNRGGLMSLYFDRASFEYPGTVYWTDSGWTEANLILHPSPKSGRPKVNVKRGIYVGGSVGGAFTGTVAGGGSAVNSNNSTDGVAPEQYSELLLTLIEAMRYDAARLDKKTRRDAVLEAADELADETSEVGLGESISSTSLQSKGMRQRLTDAAETAKNWVQAIGSGMGATEGVLKQINELMN